MIITRRAVLATTAASALALATGCREKKEAQPAPTLEAPPTGQPTSGTAEPSGDSAEQDAAPAPTDTTSPEGKAASDAAAATMAVWVQCTTLPQRQWMEQLSATLTQEAVSRYEGLFGYKLGDTAITAGPTPVVVLTDSATFTVDTDARSYEITTVPYGDGVWLTNAIIDAATGEAP